ncbi:MAG: response regulator transcription factor [Candidatus Eremiobacteraeota bacterium]|nr:response regulator transcription factor [Candidatus Eremiobacteraeota bacterium]
MNEHSRVAIVDDDRHIREMLELGLEREGFSVRSAADGQQALDLVRSWNPEIIILDVMLPKIDGFKLLPMLRAVTHVPIIMLTAKGETADKVTGLSAGADDYLGKPFAFEELIARLAANLRRPQLIQEPVYRWHGIALNMETRECRKRGELLDLTQREFDLLAVFMREPRRVFGKEHLVELIWGHDFEGSSNIVETYISYLRAKLDHPREPSLIRTVRGVGYSLIRADA